MMATVSWQAHRTEVDRRAAARQSSGTLGKIGKCQAGIFLAYAGSRDYPLLDGELARCMPGMPSTATRA